ncbi:MAG: hypothetical protein GY697_05495 [Desulfobacterales bacterium]|nr:hypothetical protein [Desulfobacterales bacterium]
MRQKDDFKEYIATVEAATKILPLYRESFKKSRQTAQYLDKNADKVLNRCFPGKVTQASRKRPYHES